jgi:hypothetical protein
MQADHAWAITADASRTNWKSVVLIVLIAATLDFIAVLVAGHWHTVDHS